MSSYFKAVQEELKDWKKALVVAIFTIARVWYGWNFMKAGIEKATTEHWFSDGKPDAAGLITKMVQAIQHSHGSDPLHLNGLIVWAAQHIFLGMPYVTDFLVVVFEICVGLFIILGLRIFWAALVGMFLNTQFAASGSANNFGYIWTNLIIMKWSKYFGLIGVDGYLRSKKGKALLNDANKAA